MSVTGIGVLVVGIEVRDQRDFLQEAGQRRVLAVLVGVGLDRADQLAQVLKPCLALLLLRFEHCLVAGFADDLARKFIQRQRDGKVAQLAVHFIKCVQRPGRARPAPGRSRLRQ